jgi:hypothetical protein
METPHNRGGASLLSILVMTDCRSLNSPSMRSILVTSSRRPGTAGLDGALFQEASATLHDGSSMLHLTQ